MPGWAGLLIGVGVGAASITCWFMWWFTKNVRMWD